MTEFKRRAIRVLIPRLTVQPPAEIFNLTASTNKDIVPEDELPGLDQDGR